MLTRCKNCGAQNAQNAKTCWYCGVRIKKAYYDRWWFYVIITTLVIGGFGYIAGSMDPSLQNKQQAYYQQAADLELIGETKGERNEFGATITGTVRNNKNKMLSYVQIVFNLYDADGNQIGTAMDNINNLEAGETWKFKATGFLDGKEIAKYKLSELSFM